MKRTFILAALAVMAFVGCNKEAAVDSIQTVDGPTAMLKVNLKAAGTITKAATTGTFEYGSETENAVKTVNFYFFTANGAAYPVSVTGSNDIKWTANTATPAESVEEVSDVVLVIKQSQTELPAKVVAVINQPVSFANKSLAKLGATILTSLKNTDGNFVMSNSVYADGNVVVNATDILPENIFAAKADVLGEVGSVIPADKVTSLKVNPIDIYVERVAAKVRVTAGTDVDFDLIPVYNEAGTTQMIDSQANKVYAKILGWDVTNTVDGANTLKAINPAWTGLGFTPWNNAAFCRSYWAEIPASEIPEHTHAFETLTSMDDKYYFENTLPSGESNDVTNTLTSGNNLTPQLLVAAQLVKADGTAIQLAKWYNVLYTIDGLKTAMVNQIASKLYVKVQTVTEEVDGTPVTNTTYRSVGVSDVDFVQRAETVADNRYEVIMTAKSGVEYYSAASAAVNTPIASADVNAIIAGVDPAQMWNEGHTYYYTDIQHFGDATGMVRNHVYDIKLNKVMGFGTPVYNPKDIITPERPDDQPAANLAAQINILSWHVVANDVTLQ